MKTIELTFPVTAEAFIAYQEAVAGRAVAESEREALGEWVPVINNCFEAGAADNSDLMHAFLDQMGENIAQSVNNSAITKLLKSMRWWMCYAYQQGRRDAEEAAV